MRVRGDITALVVCTAVVTATFAYANGSSGSSGDGDVRARDPGAAEVADTSLTTAPPVTSPPTPAAAADPAAPLQAPVARYRDGSLELVGSVADAAVAAAAAEELASVFDVPDDGVRNRLLTDPRAAGATVTVEVAERFELPQGDAVVPGALADFLELAVDALRQLPEARLVVTAHTDWVGDGPSNLALSDERARAVVDAAVAMGADRSRLVAVGVGEAQPIASNETEAGRAANRRVELRFEGITPG